MSEQTSDTLMIQRQGQVHIIEIMQPSILDAILIDRIRNGIMEILTKSGTYKIVISFENVTHLAVGVVTLVLGVVLVWYFRWFLRKIKTISVP